MIGAQRSKEACSLFEDMEPEVFLTLIDQYLDLDQKDLLNNLALVGDLSQFNLVALVIIDYIKCWASPSKMSSNPSEFGADKLIVVYTLDATEEELKHLLEFMKISEQEFLTDLQTNAHNTQPIGYSVFLTKPDREFKQDVRISIYLHIATEYIWPLVSSAIKARKKSKRNSYRVS